MNIAEIEAALRELVGGQLQTGSWVSAYPMFNFECLLRRKAADS